MFGHFGWIFVFIVYKKRPPTLNTNQGTAVSEWGGARKALGRCNGRRQAILAAALPPFYGNVRGWVEVSMVRVVMW